MSQEQTATPYRLTESDLEVLSVEHLHYDPVIRAAANPDARVLEAILALDDPYYIASAFDGRHSALNVSIIARLTKNVKKLLSAGAGANGLPRNAMSIWSARYLRYITYVSSCSLTLREEFLSDIDISQWDPLHDDEIMARQKTRLPFWGGEHPMTTSTLVTPAVTAVEAAVSVGSIEYIDAVLDAGADIKAWTEYHDAMPDNPSVSFLSPSTPLHQAISKGHIEIIHHLLHRGFRVDTFPYAATVRCMNPLMSSIAAPRGHQDLTIFKMLAASPTANLSLRNPIFNVHIAHLACAAHSIPALQELEEHLPLQDVKATALGHTLLHVVCLPLDDSRIHHFSSKIHQSIHELRSVNPGCQPWTLWPHKPPGQHIPRRPVFPYPAPKELEQQLALIEFMADRGVNIDWTVTDIHGNTPLHYLVSHRHIYEGAEVEKVKAMGSEAAWLVQNMWGHSPQDLLDDGELALRKLESEGRAIDSVSYMPHWRDPMGWWVGGVWQSRYPEDVEARRL